MASTRAPPAGMSRMHFDLSGMPLRERMPTSRHSHGDKAYDALSRSNVDVNAHMEAMYGDPSLQSMSSSQVLPPPFIVILWRSTEGGSLLKEQPITFYLHSFISLALLTVLKLGRLHL